MAESYRAFRGDPFDVPTARRFVRAILEPFPVDLDQAVLIAGELATNSINHAPGPFAVIIRRSAAEIVLGVSDTSATQPILRSASPDRVSGRGMSLVDQLAEEWHVEPRPAGKTVWARLRRR